MLEASAHNHLKKLFQQDAFEWPHNLTLSRLISRSLRREDRSFIHLDLSALNQSWLGILVPLCLQNCRVALVLTPNQYRQIIKFELPKLQLAGLNFALWEGSTPPTADKNWLLDYSTFWNAYQNGYLFSKQLIIPEAEFLSSRLRDVMTIKILAKHWDNLRRAHPAASETIVRLYQHLTSKLFSEAISTDGVVRINSNEIVALRELLEMLGDCPSPWPRVLESLTQNWVTWAQLDHKLLDWCLYLQPLESVQHLKSLFQRIPFVMIGSSNIQNDFFVNQLESFSGSLDVNVKLGVINTCYQEPIQLFAPRRQPLPNTEFFAKHLLEQSRRLILGRRGVTIICLDDDQLRRRLTSELAAEFGKRVVLESTAPDSNGVICCHSSWWLQFHDYLPVPDQLILAMLPFPSLELPLTAARVEAYKRQGKDWFRSLLLPELLDLLPRMVLPLRKYQGRIAILDGRIRARSWGEKVLRTLEPWTPLERLLPE